MMNYRRLKISIITFFVLLYGINFLGIEQAKAYVIEKFFSVQPTKVASVTPVKRPKSLKRQSPSPNAGQNPNPSQNAGQEPQEIIIMTAEQIKDKYGSLDKIPIHKVHDEIKVVDEKGEEKKLECLDCHAVEENATGKDKVRYLAQVQCSICHIDDKDERQKYPHPPLPTGRETIGQFSHTAHLDPAARLSKNGQRQDCVYCHNPKAMKATTPTHSECIGCHSGPTSARPIFNDKSQECLVCHTIEILDRNILAPSEGRTKMPLSVSAHGSYSDVNPINHSLHLKDRYGNSIDCMQCHQSILRKADVEQVAQLPTMNDCATCHANIKKTSLATQMENCAFCHREITSTDLPLTTTVEKNKELTPPNGVRKPMPIDHTAIFRTNHQKQAEQPNSRCASCHSGIEMNARDNCASCHSLMRPRNHSILRFSDIDHGRLAAMGRSSCATCHTTESCARCHTLLPRDHQPLGVFAGGTHKFRARSNMRACLTCHTYENTCQPCHVPQLTDATPATSKRKSRFPF